MVKFLEQVYHHIPRFKNNVSTSQEFVEALASTLFPPTFVITVNEVDDVEDNEVYQLTLLL